MLTSPAYSHAVFPLIAGLREDFGVRTKSAITAMREAGTDRSTQEPKKGRGRLEVLQNKGVAARAQRDLEELEVHSSNNIASFPLFGNVIYLLCPFYALFFAKSMPFALTSSSADKRHLPRCAAFTVSFICSSACSFLREWLLDLPHPVHQANLLSTMALQ